MYNAGVKLKFSNYCVPSSRYSSLLANLRKEKLHYRGRKYERESAENRRRFRRDGNR